MPDRFPSPDELQRAILEARRPAPAYQVPAPMLDALLAPEPIQAPGAPPAWGMTPDERAESRARMIERADKPITPSVVQPTDFAAPAAGMAARGARSVASQIEDLLARRGAQRLPKPDLPPLPAPDPGYNPLWAQLERQAAAEREAAALSRPRSIRPPSDSDLMPLPPAGNSTVPARLRR